MGTPQKATSCILLKNMKVISAYMLAVVGGNTSPSKDDVTKILASVGIDLDDACSAQLDSLIEQMAEKSYDEILKEGLEQVKKAPGASGGGGGGGAGPAAAASGGAAGGAAPAAAEEEEEEEEEAAVGGGLFGD